MPTQSVLVIQHILMHYRAPLLNRLHSASEFSLTLAVSEFGNGIDRTKLNFSARELVVVHIGGLRMIRGFVPMARNYDLVVIPFDLHELALLNVFTGRAGRVILWGHSHGSSRLSDLLRRSIASRAAAQVVYTDHGKRRLLEEDATRKNVFVANNTIDVPFAEFAALESRSSFLFSGRLTPRKKVADALQAFAKVIPFVDQSVMFEIVGQGPHESKLRRLVYDLEIGSRVIFHGAIFDPKTLAGIFQRALAFVSPGHIGLGVLHSFAFGVPPITTAGAQHAPEFHHIHDRVNGYLYDGTVENLANIMREITSNRDHGRVCRSAFNYYHDYCSLDNAVTGMLDAFRHATECTRR